MANQTPLSRAYFKKIFNQSKLGVNKSKVVVSKWRLRWLHVVGEWQIWWLPAVTIGQWVPAAGDGNAGCMVAIMGWVATSVGVSCDDGDGIASGGEDGVDGEMVVAIVEISLGNYSGGQNSPC
ncbi:hypothetical protein Tco_1222698 [Tanacetum coccineum]